MTDSRKTPGQILSSAVREMGITGGPYRISADKNSVTIDTYRVDANGRPFLTEAGEPAAATHVLGTHFLGLHQCSAECSSNDEAAR